MSRKDNPAVWLVCHNYVLMGHLRYARSSSHPDRKLRTEHQRVKSWLCSPTILQIVTTLIQTANATRRSRLLCLTLDGTGNNFSEVPGVTLISDRGNSYDARDPRRIRLYTDEYSKPSELPNPRLRRHGSSDLFEWTWDPKNLLDTPTGISCQLSIRGIANNRLHVKGILFLHGDGSNRIMLRNRRFLREIYPVVDGSKCCTPKTSDPPQILSHRGNNLLKGEMDTEKDVNVASSSVQREP